jgi:hypothetical protein
VKTKKLLEVVLRDPKEYLATKLGLILQQNTRQAKQQRDFIQSVNDRVKFLCTDDNSMLVKAKLGAMFPK